MLSSLPSTLLALLFALPTISAQTSSNDPFRAISTHAPQTPQDPICCLKPLPPLEPQHTEEELLLSFEDWKAKLLAEDKSNAIATQVNESVRLHSGKDSVGGRNGAGGGGKEDSPAVAGSPLDPGTASFSQDQLDAGEQVSPHFRVPLTDRFNYANLDCSAQVHMSHRSAKSPSSILSSKKDRYMLSPCSTEGKENHFVVVELCDDIRIDTVQLANFEFFSGVFKDLTVSVAKTYTTDPEGWINAGTYRAKNVRGVQSFHPPTSLRDFYRYIRIDFHSHYGSEYYCPVSLLRVFGLTHLEEWKWDVWESESRAKRSGQLSATFIDAPSTVSEDVLTSSLFPGPPTDTVDQDSGSSNSISATTGDSQSRDSPHHNTDVWASEKTMDSPNTPPTTAVSQPGASSSLSISNTQYDTLTSPNEPTTTATTTVENQSQTVLHPASQVTSSVSPPSEIISSSATSASAPPDPVDKSSDHSADRMVFSTGDAPSSMSRSSSASSPTPVISLSSQPLLNSPHISSGGGESIYRTIMNRLTVLELNTTLYTRYVEEQTAGVREVLRRLGEDVGRLEGLGKAQAQMYQRSLLEMERQRRRVELEHKALMSRINNLADEVVMEKRLGIAQLCILVAVLVFMALTRGSRGELIDHRPAILQRFSRGNSWGQRTLSLSGDWVNRFRSMSPTPKSVDVNSRRQENDKAEFLSIRANPSRTAHHMSTSTGVRRTAVRPRTPQSRTPARYTKPPTPIAMPPASLLLPQMLSRASSHGNPASSDSGGFIGPAPKSAKKWARTAHLHQVKNGIGTESGRAREMMPLRVNTDIDEPPGIMRLTPNGRKKKSGSRTRRSSPLRIFPPRMTDHGGGSGENEVDIWVDTDDTSSDADFVQENLRHVGHRELMAGSATLAVGA